MQPRAYDIDNARRRLDFSGLLLDAILDKPNGLFLEWALEQIGRPVAVDRIAYLRSGKDMHDLFLAAGYGIHLPMVSSCQVQITPDQLSRLKAGGWIWTPTDKIGWDAFFSFRSNGQLGVIAIDDTSTSRIFTEADQEYLIHAARWFGKCYASRLDIDHDRRRATNDSLTKLPNQRTVIKRLKETVDGVLSGEIKEACVTLLDIDDFKLVNDTYGHPFGDKVLRTLADIISSSPGNFAGRYGGEEFMVISYSSLQQSVRLIYEFLEGFRQTQLVPTGGDKPYIGTFSAGTYAININRLPDKDTKENADFCYQEADKLMYQAKHQGKARVCSA
jgi:diguanylate cyclase (GGDEF)-like protein